MSAAALIVSVTALVVSVLSAWRIHVLNRAEFFDVFGWWMTVAIAGLIAIVAFAFWLGLHVN